VRLPANSAIGSSRITAIWRSSTGAPNRHVGEKTQEVAAHGPCVALPRRKPRRTIAFRHLERTLGQKALEIDPPKNVVGGSCGAVRFQARELVTQSYTATLVARAIRVGSREAATGEPSGCKTTNRPSPPAGKKTAYRIAWLGGRDVRKTFR
jgi:hypothetical protein